MPRARGARRGIYLILDEDDYNAVQSAMARRQSRRDESGGPILPPGESNTAGALVAEICRGWCEFLDHDRQRREGPDAPR
jgi:hypothetical protein